MIKINKNQSGFGAVEFIMAIIIIVLLLAVGYFVYKNHHQPTKVVTVTKTVIAPKSSSSSTTTTATTASNTFKIPELGIEIINVPTSLTGLTYAVKSSGSSVDTNNKITTPTKYTFTQFSTNALTLADPACSASNGTSIGGLGSVAGTYVNNGPVDDTIFVKQFNGFYITYSHPQAACSNNTAAETIHTTQTSTFDTLVNNPNNLQLIN